MKRNRLGKESPGSHRRFSPNQLRQRYLRARYADEESQREIDGTVNEIDVSYDYCGDDCAYCNPSYGLDDFRVFQVEKWLDERLNRRPLFPGFMEKQRNNEKVNRKLRDEQSDSRLNCLDIETRLWAHIEAFSQLKAHKFCKTIEPWLSDPRQLEEVKRQTHNKPALGRLICFYAPFWTRDPASFRGASLRGFISHIFTPYRVPDCLYKVWNEDTSLDQHKWISWFILWGQGGSHRRTASKFQWNASGKWLQFLFEAPRHLNPDEACLFAYIRSLDGGHRVFEWILAHAQFHFDPSNPSFMTTPLCLFVQQLTKWLIKHQDMLETENATRLMNWAHHMHIESRRNRGTPPFSLKNRTVGSVLRASQEYEDQINRLAPRKDAFAWDNKGWDWQFEDGLDVWHISELTDTFKLQLEGRRMQHCVGSYTQFCATGYSSIFNLRLNDVSKATVQIEMKTLSIKQARGRRNRSVSTAERNILNKWMVQVVKEIGYQKKVTPVPLRSYPIDYLVPELNLDDL